MTPLQKIKRESELHPRLKNVADAIDGDYAIILLIKLTDAGIINTTEARAILGISKECPKMFSPEAAHEKIIER